MSQLPEHGRAALDEGLIRRTANAARVVAAATEQARIQLTAEWILDAFDDCYAEFL